MNLFIIILIVALDQISKAYLMIYLKTLPGCVCNINQYMDFVFSWNHGISFGLFGNFKKYSNSVFIVINTAITLFLFSIWWKEKQGIVKLSYSLVIAGAIGNICDRIIRGAVFDFIHLHYNKFHFAVFNIADFFITTGVLLFLLKSVVKRTNR